MKSHPPSKLIYKNKIFSSPKELTEILNDHYINKIKKIRQSFNTSKIKPLDILKKLRPRVSNKLIIPPITIYKTKKIINKIKTSNATGWDDVTSRILKKVTNMLAPHITHLINSIIKTATYPLIYKIS